MKGGIEFLYVRPPDDEKWALAVRQIQIDDEAERRQRKALRKLIRDLRKAKLLKKPKKGLRRVVKKRKSE